MYFEIVGPITDIETIAVGRAIRQLSQLRRRHGQDVGVNSKGSPRSASPAASCGVPRSTGMRHMESDAFATRSRCF